MNLLADAPKLVSIAIARGWVKMPEPKVRRFGPARVVPRLPGESEQDFRRRYNREKMRQYRQELLTQ